MREIQLHAGESFVLADGTVIRAGGGRAEPPSVAAALQMLGLAESDIELDELGLGYHIKPSSLAALLSGLPDTAQSSPARTEAGISQPCLRTPDGAR